MTYWNLKFFLPHELADRDTRIVKLAPASKEYKGFGERIDMLRAKWGKPLTVNSCCRSKVRNTKIGGHSRSLHVYDFPFHPTGGTAAIDIRETSEEFRQLAWDMGFSIGIAKTYTHLDDRFPLLGMPQAKFNY